MDIHMSNAADASPLAQSQSSARRRVRVSRACDECRLRKTRCDGRQPCASCDTFERHCSYNLNQGRRPAQRTRILEDRLRRAHQHIKELQKLLPNYAHHIDADELFQVPVETSSVGDPNSADEGEATPVRRKSPQLDNMMNGPGYMTSASWFAGNSSGFAFLLKTRELLKEESAEGQKMRRDDESNENGQEPATETAPTACSEAPAQKALVQLYDAPLPSKQVLDLKVPLGHLLPSKENARKLLYLVYDYVYPLLQFMSRHDMEHQMERIYSIDPVDFTPNDHEFLPLFYSIMALSLLFSRERHSRYGCEKSITQAIAYHIAASRMTDITHCQSLTSLQTLICFTLFFMSSGRLATAHTYVGLSMATALKMGFHIKSPANASFTEHERDMRRRVFWTITKLDSYISSILGLPLMFDQDGVEITSQQVIDEVYSNSLQEMDEEKRDESYQMAASAAHFKLLLITAKATSTLFGKGDHPMTMTTRFPKLAVSSSKVGQAEEAISQWCKEYNDIFDHDDEDDCIVVTKFDLRMTLAFTRIVLYKPFLHYLSSRHHSDPPATETQLRLAYACVSAAREAIENSRNTFGGSLLGQASWPASYTVFMSITCLIFFLATQRAAPEQGQIQKDAESGIRILASTTCPGSGTAKCLDVIEDLVRCLQKRVKIDVVKIRAEAPLACSNPDARPYSSSQNSNPRTSGPRSERHDVRQRGPWKSSSDNQRRPDATPQRPTPQQSQQQQQQQRPVQPSPNQYLDPTNFVPMASYPSMMAGPYQPNMTYAQPMTNSSFSDIGQEHSQLDAVHIPFDGSFTWMYEEIGNPMDQSTRQPNSQRFDGGHMMSNSRFPISSEDIATYFAQQHEANERGSGR